MTLPDAPVFSAASALSPFVLLLLAPLRVSLALPLLRLAPHLVSLALLLSLAFAPAYTPLSGTSAAPSVLLSQCLVTVLLSLCSWFVAPVAPGAEAPVPEAFVPHL